MPPDFLALKALVDDVHRGFGCGRDSRLGIHLDVTRDDEGHIVASWQAGPRDEGPPGIVHGGVQGIIVDAMAGWATAEHQARRGDDPLRFPVTVEMDLRFRTPLPIGVPLMVRAWAEEQSGRRVRSQVVLGTVDMPVCTESRVVYHLLERAWFPNPYR